MKWYEAIQIATNDKTVSWFPNTTSWEEVYNITIGPMTEEQYNSFTSRLKKYWITKWYCTDSWVGLAVYCLDGVPVAISGQSGRKYPEEIEFIGQNQERLCREFIFSFVNSTEPLVQFVDLYAEIDARWFEQ